ncbi:hypothetical protein [Frigidibacter sp. ROC022]|uniref:hypothetical protein n=1 Tax=Frigidibacter sp. ROC022 TaxID=2971796 RepID=UPI00215B6328|nr:hypothetical protein [Frigidibacter sp. ROC022]MCR8725923.1 hypothetical protein [Frigidibacter sp. ROC022]
MEKIETKVLKAVGDAQKAMARLMTELRPLVSNVRRGEIDGGLAVKLYKRAKATLGRFGKVTRLRDHPVFPRLSEAVRAQVDWISMLMTGLLQLKARLDKARKQSKLYVSRKWRMHLKVAREAVRAAPQVPPKLRAMMKKAEKAKDDFEDADRVPYVPMSLLLVQLADAISKGLKTRPRIAARV